MDEPRFDELPVGAASGSGPHVVLRRTRAQRAVGALGWSLCALPIVAGSLLAGDAGRALLVAGLVAAVVAGALDLVARRDVHVTVTPDALLVRNRSLPWWAVGEVRVRRRAGVRTVVVSAFGTERLVLPTPRTGPVVRNRHFDADAAVVQRAWSALHRPVGSPAVRKQA